MLLLLLILSILIARTFGFSEPPFIAGIKEFLLELTKPKNCQINTEIDSIIQSNLEMHDFAPYVWFSPFLLAKISSDFLSLS